MNNKFILESLASDLKRVSLGFYRGSDSMARRFLVEALKRKSEVDIKLTAPYINKILSKLDEKIDAENALMFSTLIQNYTQKQT
jgi:hypothetical protein